MGTMDKQSTSNPPVGNDQRGRAITTASLLSAITIALVLLILAAASGVAGPELRSIGVATALIVLAIRRDQR